MKLYYAHWRQGVKTSTIRRPGLVSDMTAAQEAGMGVQIEEFWNIVTRWPDGRVITFEQQWQLIRHFLIQGVLVYHLQGAALKFFVTEKLLTLSGAAVESVALGFLVYIGLLYFAMWLWNPSIRESVWEQYFGTKWLMRYEGRVWGAKWTGFFDHDMPIFEQLDEIGDVIAFETRGGVGNKWIPDVWLTLDSWTELKERHVGWDLYTWTQILPVFHGLCVQVERGFYGLQKSYHGFLPPVSQW